MKDDIYMHHKNQFSRALCELKIVIACKSCEIVNDMGIIRLKYPYYPLNC